MLNRGPGRHVSESTLHLAVGRDGDGPLPKDKTFEPEPSCSQYERLHGRSTNPEDLAHVGPTSFKSFKS
jgi:hypothetical protein